MCLLSVLNLDVQGRPGGCMAGQEGSKAKLVQGVRLHA